LALIKWGHIWRQQTNLKHGILTVDDDREAGSDKSAPSEDVEKAEGPTLERDIEAHQDEEARDEHGSINLNTQNRRPRRNSDMPPVREVLKRTTSLSQASVQG
jgi:hypothetical protein